MQQIQQLCGADDNPRTRMNTGDSQHRDPYLTHVLIRLMQWVMTVLTQKPKAMIIVRILADSKCTEGFRALIDPSLTQVFLHHYSDTSMDEHW